MTGWVKCPSRPGADALAKFDNSQRLPAFIVVNTNTAASSMIVRVLRSSTKLNFA